MVHAGESAGDEAARNRRAAEALRQRAARLEVRAAKFERGQQGERTVAHELDALGPDGYLRLDDCRWPGRPRANIDHVLIGPAGLFVVDAKNWSGRVEVRAGVFRQNGYRRMREADGVAEAAQAVAGLVPGGVPRVGGMICLCGEAQMPPMVVNDSCSVVPVTGVADWVRSQPALLTSAAVSAIHDELVRRLEPASGPAVKADASPVPDFVPERWPAGPVRREPRSVARPPRSPLRSLAQRRRHRFSRRGAVVGRVLLLLLMIDAVGSAAVSATNRAGDLIVFVVCLAWLARLERRRPVVTNSRR